MPKRKRGAADNGDEEQKKEIVAKLVHGKKLLNRALKLAKNFERQKIDKRLKVSQKEDPAKLVRLQKEAEALKVLDVLKLVDAHLYKNLLKTKSIAESGLLPDFVALVARDVGEGEEERLAFDNVTARMYNMKPVKETMTQVMGAMYAAVGVPNPAMREKLGKEKAPKKQKMVVDEEDDEDEGVHSEEVESNNAPPKSRKTTKIESIQDVEPAWEGFDSGSEADSESDVELSKYSSRLAGSSDDDSEDDEEFSIPRPSRNSLLKTLNPRDMSISPEPSKEEEDDLSESDNELSRPTKPVKVARAATKQGKPVPLKSGSTFLPTLMGGYWSGSEGEVITDDETVAPPPRKNRRGQQERRALAEKKFGGSAKHLMAGKGPASAMGNNPKNPSGRGRDAGWDAKRGASDGSRGRGGRGGRGGTGRNGFVRSKETVTGENATPLVPRKHRDDVGKLHPSWEAKKAKEEKVNAKFEGKKIVFD